METIRISPDEESNHKDFKDGKLSAGTGYGRPSDKDEFAKGKTVRVVHGNFEGQGRIVLQPLIIERRLEGER